MDEEINEAFWRLMQNSEVEHKDPLLDEAMELFEKITPILGGTPYPVVFALLSLIISPFAIPGQVADPVLYHNVTQVYSGLKATCGRDKSRGMAACLAVICAILARDAERSIVHFQEQATRPTDEV